MQERYEVVMSGKAKDDLKYIITYINATLNEPTIAKKYVKIIRERIKSLEYFPQKYVIIDDEKLMDLKIRKLIIKNYIAFYRINENKKIVTIERIIYGKNDWINKLELAKDWIVINLVFLFSKNFI